MLHEKMTALADAIRAKTGGEEKLTLDGMAAAIPEVYEAGKNAAGGGGNYDEGYNDGMKAEYDRFWDAFQENGNKTNYNKAFSNNCWTENTFKPKYAIRPKTARELFFGNEVLQDYVNVVEIDFSECTDPYYAFRGTHIQRIGVCDFRSATTLNGIFTYSTAHTIDEIIVDEDLTYNKAFAVVEKLTNLKFSGVIGQNGLDVSAAKKLTHESLMSIIGALKDYSGSGTTYTVTLGTTNLAKLTDAEKAIATQKGWTLA